MIEQSDQEPHVDPDTSDNPVTNEGSNLPNADTTPGLISGRPLGRRTSLTGGVQRSEHPKRFDFSDGFRRLRVLEKKERIQAELNIEAAETNKELVPVAMAVIETAIKILNQPNQVREFLVKLVSGESLEGDLHQVSQLLQFEYKPDFQNELVSALISTGVNDPGEVYSYIMTGSNYAHPRRESVVHINILPSEQLLRALDSIEDDETRHNITRSILLVFCEELAHLAQFNKLDLAYVDILALEGEEFLESQEPTPFLSKAMESSRYSKGNEEAASAEIEADITFFLLEMAQKLDLVDVSKLIESSIWIENHRKNYGHESEIISKQQ